MSDFAKFLLKAYVRQGLTLLGGILVAYGTITQSEADSLVGQYLEQIVGVIVIAVAAGWKFVYHKYVKAKIETARELEPTATKAELERATEQRLKAA